MRVLFFTEYGSNYAEIAAVTVPIMRKYCERHGYEFRELILEGTGNEYAFKKNWYLTKVFREGIDLIFYLDVDAVITNHDIRIESFLDEEHEMFITEHCGEVNGGAILIKNSTASIKMNEAVLSYSGKVDNEQNALTELMKEPSFAKLVKIVPHPAFNSIEHGLYPELKDSKELSDWEEGHFVCHFPALGINDRLELVKEYSEKIIK